MTREAACTCTCTCTFPYIAVLFAISKTVLQVPLLGARFNVYWSGMHIQMSDVRRLMPHQRVNHFPRSVHEHSHAETG